MSDLSGKPAKARRTQAITGKSAALYIILLLLLLLPAVADTAFAQQVDLDRIEAYIAAARAEWQVPGLAVAIVKDGDVVFEKGFGTRVLGGNEPVDEHTLFAIASNSKAFTAAALAMLVDEGKLAWDDPVRRHLPYFELYDPYVSAEMRVRDLLTHRSGLGTYSGDMIWYGTEYSPEEILRRTRHLPATGPFRAHYGYSNLMFVAAGEIVPAVTGQSWSDFVQERFFDPLGMTRTITSVRDLESTDNIANPHKPTPDEIHAIPWFNWDAMAAAGGIISSVHDIAKWLKLQLGRGEFAGKRYFSDDASHEMWSAQTVIPVSRASMERYPSIHFRAYGLGWSLNDYEGRKIVSHGGGYDGMYSRVVMVPEENLAAVILTNSMTGIATALSNRILDAYLGAPERDWSSELLTPDREGRQRFYDRIEEALKPKASQTTPSLPLEHYAGTYGGPFYGDASVTLENGALVLRLLPAADLVADLSHLHHDTFRIDWRQEYAWFGPGTAHFVLNAGGEPAELKLDVPNEDLWFHELELRRN